MLTGQKGVPGNSSMEVLGHQVDPSFQVTLPDEIALPESFRAVIDKMLVKDLSGRYADGREILEDLAAIEDEIKNWESGQFEDIPTLRIEAGDELEQELEAVEVTPVEPAPQADSSPPTDSLAPTDSSPPTDEPRSPAPEATHATAEDASSAGFPTKTAVMVVVALVVVSALAVMVFGPDSQPSQPQNSSTGAASAEPATSARGGETPGEKAGEAQAVDRGEPAASESDGQQPAADDERAQQAEASPKGGSDEGEKEEAESAKTDESPEVEPEKEAEPNTKEAVAEPSRPARSKPASEPEPEGDDSSEEVEVVEGEDGVKKVIRKVDGPLFGD